MAESAFKLIKIQDYTCTQCGKRFNDLSIYQTHLKTKHPENKPVSSEVKSQNKEAASPEPRTEPQKSKVQPKPKHKNKGSEQMQQDTEDRIYAFLGELGVRHVEPDSQQENINEDDDRMMGQANYLENNIVRTPFEIELDVKKEVESIDLLDKPAFDKLLESLKEEVILLNERLVLETDRWEFRDPIEMEKDEEEEFSLISIPNVLNNYRKKGLDLKYPQFSVFLLWLGKICKAVSWKQFFLITAYINFKYDEYLKTKAVARSQTTWKLFFQELGNLGDAANDIQDSLHLLNREQISNFIDLYEKWVCYFDPL